MTALAEPNVLRHLSRSYADTPHTNVRVSRIHAEQLGHTLTRWPRPKTPPPMELFLAERYLTELATEQELVSLIERDRAAAAAMSVRHVQTIYVPADETCFTLFEAPSADLVTATSDRFALGFRRVCRAITVYSPQTGEGLHDHHEP